MINYKSWKANKNKKTPSILSVVKEEWKANVNLLSKESK